ncbi:MAG: hypothetical protein ACRD2B_02720 [Terriglobia bacterium]
MKRILLVVLGLVVLVYLADYLSVRFRIPRGRHTLGSVTLERYYAVLLKNGKHDLYFEPPRKETCVRSMFPHLGYEPCWYLSRKKEQRVNE